MMHVNKSVCVTPKPRKMQHKLFSFYPPLAGPLPKQLGSVFSFLTHSLLVLGDHAVNVVERANTFLEVHRQGLEDAIGGIEHQAVDSGVKVLLGDLLARVGSFEFFANLVTTALDSTSLVEVEALLDNIEFHEGQVLDLIVLNQSWRKSLLLDQQFGRGSLTSMRSM